MNHESQFIQNQYRMRLEMMHPKHNPWWNVAAVVLGFVLIFVLLGAV